MLCEPADVIDGNLAVKITQLPHVDVEKLGPKRVSADVLPHELADESLKRTKMLV
jgi:hypothetical protein